MYSIWTFSVELPRIDEGEPGWRTIGRDEEDSTRCAVLCDAHDRSTRLRAGILRPKSAPRIASLHIPYEFLNTIFLSHLHTAHSGDFAAYFLGGWQAGRQETPHVYGPSGSRSETGTRMPGRRRAPKRRRRAPKRRRRAIARSRNTSRSGSPTRNGSSARPCGRSTIASTSNTAATRSRIRSARGPGSGREDLSNLMLSNGPPESQDSGWPLRSGACAP
jgi:hypothetical protein